jgi:alkylhydroperoxidase family enzyme
VATETRVPAAEITGVYGYLVKKFSRKMLGEVPESAGVMWQYPKLFKNVMSFGYKADKWNRLDPGLASLAAMAAASYVGCSFCLDLGYFMTRNRGLDEVKAREVPRWRESDVFTDLERKAMEYAEAMSQTPPAVTDAMAAGLLDELGAPALVELTTRIAVMNLNARVNIALGIRSQGFSTACGLPPLASPSSESESPSPSAGSTAAS